MHLGTIFLLGIAVNLDNLFIGMSYGLAKKAISASSNLLIALISGLASYVICAGAQMLTRTFSSLATVIGSGLLIGLGIWTIISCLRKKSEKEDAAGPAAKSIGFMEILMLGFALALNALAASLGMGLSGFSALEVGVSVGICSYMAVGLGNYFGKKAVSIRAFGKLDMIGGLILIVIGVWELFL